MNKPTHSTSITREEGLDWKSELKISFCQGLLTCQRRKKKHKENNTIANVMI
jgi:hypothetical protein